MVSAIDVLSNPTIAYAFGYLFVMLYVVELMYVVSVLASAASVGMLGPYICHGPPALMYLSIRVNCSNL